MAERKNANKLPETNYVRALQTVNKSWLNYRCNKTQA